MKYISLVVALLFVAAFAVADSPAYTLSTLSSPTSVEGGASFSLQIQIQNSGLGAATNVNIYPEIEGPFEIKTGTKTSEDIATLNAGQTAVATFDFVTTLGADSGVYIIKLLVDDDSGLKAEKEISITIEASPDLEVVNTEAPEVIYPGDTIDLNLVMKNIGGGQANNIRITFANTSTFTPVGAGVGYSELIRPGSQKTMTIPLSIDGEAKGGSYTLPITINFEDNTGTVQTAIQRNIGIKVQSNIDLKTYLDDQDPITSGISGDSVVKIANTGPNTAQYLEVLLESEHFDISPTSFYIGNLESDDFDTVDFNAWTSNAAGEYPLTVKLIYKDQYNQQKEEIQTVNLKVLSSAEYRKQVPKSYGGLYLLIIILAAVGYWYYKKKYLPKKKKRK